MVSTTQIQTGITRYVDNDLMPHLTGVKKLGLGVYTALAAENIGAAIQKYKDHPAVAMTHVIQEDGTIDIDRLYGTVRPMFEQRQSFDIPLLGKVTFDGQDVEKLYRYITEA